MINTKLLQDSYTYFETELGLLAYTYGKQARYNDEKMVCSIVGYFTKKPTNRLQTATGRFIEKLMYEGNEGNLDFDEHLVSLPKSIKKQLKRYTLVDQNSGERLLIIPVQDVVKVYSPRESLREIVNESSKIDSKRRKAILKLITLLQRYNIKIGDLGLYGSLQIGVANKSDKVDIDLLIFGIENYSKLQILTEQQNYKLNVDSKYKSIREFLPWKKARQCRDSCSKIFIDEKSHADIKIVRKQNDPISFDFQNLELERESFAAKGVVLDSNQGLSTPSVFKVQIAEQIYTVGTRIYVYIGAAKEGNTVVIKGRKIKGKNAILVANAKDNFIYPIY
ncbi:MAG: hypothetical protein UX88_C0011G0010 [Candidatus Woesebacteria bacterium GW2011_GWC2_47_16]|nr:MAG: hypothetical protein UX67_C0039G0005 [Candidatus Woesebacteria bacterium GW2011_GWF2_46_8]KKU64593.1 MAG: hypothetical protein UX88_C0011G0010 [Candidatus Woesebacteria bacterium GW2011_GWC2_47_16]OGM85559.1 MAG: hypothetical protein A2435_01280 [Candidatus Woesebacteria bacterium RIFOXYC1_FULL_46_16]OGM88934.1 MAG: hypothetical protein A2597_02340 [Candidatus Woesebacteria bacterium RIFOXYD1_FULL_46_19]